MNPRTLLRLLLAVMAGALTVAFSSAASAATNVDRAAAAFADGEHVYVAPTAVGHPLSQSDVDRLTRAVEDTSTQIFVAALGEPHSPQASADLREIIDRVHLDGTYVVVGEGGFLAQSDVPGVQGSTGALVRQAIEAHRGQPVAELVEFVRLVDAAASSGAAGADDGSGLSTDVPGDDSSGGTAGAWVPLAAILAVVGAGLIAMFRSGRRRRDQADAAAFAEVRASAEQDVTALGEELTALDVPPSSAPEATGDYQAALDSYDRAKAYLERARHPEELGAVTNALEEGRWRLACVRARLSGQTVPERRPPCFFNPRHGPSVTDVQWAPPGGVPRTVPVCAADADAVARGADPDARMVQAGGRVMPYWSAPAYYGPYAGGFFGGWGGGSFLGGLLLGEMLTGGFGGWGGGWGAYDSGYDAGYAAGDQADGGLDDPGDFAGDFDSGGGGWGGGGDWGGGDFGGGGGGDFGGGGDW